MFQNGSWHSSTVLYQREYEEGGDNLQSLSDYLVKKGRIKKYGLMDFHTYTTMRDWNRRVDPTTAPPKTSTSSTGEP